MSQYKHQRVVTVEGEDLQQHVHLRRLYACLSDTSWRRERGRGFWEMFDDPDGYARGGGTDEIYELGHA